MLTDEELKLLTHDERIVYQALTPEGQLSKAVEWKEMLRVRALDRKYTPADPSEVWLDAFVKGRGEVKTTYSGSRSIAVILIVCAWMVVAFAIINVVMNFGQLTELGSMNGRAGEFFVAVILIPFVTMMGSALALFFGSSILRSNLDTADTAREILAHMAANTKR